LGYVIHAPIPLWNQPVLSNEGIVLQLVYFNYLVLTWKHLSFKMVSENWMNKMLTVTDCPN